MFRTEETAGQERLCAEVLTLCVCIERITTIKVRPWCQCLLQINILWFIIWSKQSYLIPIQFGKVMLWLVCIINTDTWFIAWCKYFLHCMISFSCIQVVCKHFSPHWYRYFLTTSDRCNLAYESNIQERIWKGWRWYNTKLRANGKHSPLNIPDVYTHT